MIVSGLENGHHPDNETIKRIEIIEKVSKDDRCVLRRQFCARK